MHPKNTGNSHLEYGRVGLYAVCTIIFVFLVVPCLIVIPMSFNNGRSFEVAPTVLSLRWYREFFRSPEWLESLWVSLKVAIPTVLIATPVGTAAAYTIARSSSKMARRLGMIFMLPMILPHILIAVSVFTVFSYIGLNNTITGLILAHTMLALPFVVITVGSGLKNFDTSQEAAAIGLGASKLVAFITVTAPQIKLSIIAGGFFAFFTSFDEIMLVLFISSGANSTLSRKMFVQMRDEIDPTIAAISAMFVVASIVIVLASTLVRARSSAEA